MSSCAFDGAAADEGCAFRASLLGRCAENAFDGAAADGAAADSAAVGNSTATGWQLACGRAQKRGDPHNASMAGRHDLRPERHALTLNCCDEDDQPAEEAGQPAQAPAHKGRRKLGRKRLASGPAGAAAARAKAARVEETGAARLPVPPAPAPGAAPPSAEPAAAATAGAADDADTGTGGGAAADAAAESTAPPAIPPLPAVMAEPNAGKTN